MSKLNVIVFITVVSLLVSCTEYKSVTIVLEKDLGNNKEILTINKTLNIEEIKSIKLIQEGNTWSLIYYASGRGEEEICIFYYPTKIISIK
jgi:hypothetical protein